MLAVGKISRRKDLGYILVGGTEGSSLNWVRRRGERLLAMCNRNPN